MTKAFRSGIGLAICVLFLPWNGWGQQGSFPSDRASIQVEETSAAPDLSQKITLELKGVDILDVLKVLSKKSGMNIVAGRDVRGQVTLYLQNVDVWDAFKTVLETSELAYEEKEGIIKVMTERNYEQLYGHPYNDQRKGRLFHFTSAKAADVSNVLNQIKSNIGKIIVDERTNSIIVFDIPSIISDMENYIHDIDRPSCTRVISLQYAKVTDLEPKVAELVTQGTGSLKIDERTNRLVVTDTLEKVERIAKIAAAFDEEPRQVLLEAKVVRVQLNDDYRFGVDYDALVSRLGKDLVKFAAGFPPATPSLTSIAPGLVTNDLTTLTVSTKDFTAVIKLLDTMGKVNVLATPRVTVLNNEEARFTSATREPFVSNTVVQATAGQTNAANVQFVDVGITLTVTPTIMRDGKILVKIKPEVSSKTSTIRLGAEAGSTADINATTIIPVVSTSEAETKVLIQNGNIIVLGGLIDETQTKEVSKLPILGDLPFIGIAFRSRGDDFVRKEIVVFLKASLVNPQERTPEFNKFFQQDENNLRDFDEVGNYNYDNVYYESHGPWDNRVRPYWLVDGTEKPEWQRPVNVYGEGRTGKKAAETKGQESGRAPKISFSNGASSSQRAYADYLKGVIHAALAGAKLPAEKGSRVTIRLTVLKDGILEKLAVETEKPNSQLESPILDLVKDLAPFDDFPNQMTESKAQFIFTVQF